MLVEGYVTVSIQFFQGSLMCWKNQKVSGEDEILLQKVFIPVAGNVSCCVTNMCTGICCSMELLQKKIPASNGSKVRNEMGLIIIRLICLSVMLAS
jgi:hypothetical protein